MTTKQQQVQEIIEELKKGTRFANEAAGYSYSLGTTMMKINYKGDIKFFVSIEEMAKAILKSQNTGV